MESTSTRRHEKAIVNGPVHNIQIWLCLVAHHRRLRTASRHMIVVAVLSGILLPDNVAVNVELNVLVLERSAWWHVDRGGPKRVVVGVLR